MMTEMPMKVAPLLGQAIHMHRNSKPLLAAQSVMVRTTRLGSTVTVCAKKKRVQNFRDQHHTQPIATMRYVGVLSML